MSIEFRPFRALDELPLQRALFRDSFPENIGAPPESDAHYHWKFQRFPAMPPSYEYGAYEGGNLFGYYAAIPYPYVIDGRPATCGMVCDVMTHSAARRRGIFTNMGRYSVAELARQDLDFLSGYPIRPEVLPGHLKVGWRVAFELPIYVKFLKTNAALASKGLGGLAGLGNLVAAAYRGLTDLRRPGEPPSSIEVVSPAELARLEDYDVFFEEWGSEVPHHLVKSREFLAWRLGAPGATYQIVLVRNAARRIVAMAITRATTLQGLPSLAILDLMIPARHRAHAGALHRRLTALAQASGLEALAVMMSPTNARAVGARRYGFLRSPFRFSVIVYPLHGTDLGGEDRWQLTWIDSDDL